ncbi:MAG: RdgB/HAM1 family non-canonical purine NTP pyrophosphatase [Chitinophagaceae bacterium]|nr:RdgB/HAM1 family non-canonical purine NTP pyrophosphatase [Chitinophagaceae bacterium]MCF8289635.1 RdgB/HAM1 family non-canonical purine NTP pyrophosphatase [Chitinophagaceae bacterium]MCF8422390.1 RdgB/HAM1 family non-canonical purine NTP pyrophosphatase [Chitinophagaceae bacterium]
MHTLIFATNNRNKVAEIQSLVGANFTIIPLKEAGIEIDIPEPHDQLEANAHEKAMTIFNLTHQNCFSEDTGLEIVALNGAPGVKSARYAGENSNAQANIDLVLSKMAGIENRTAQFRTVICLIWENQTYYFEGVCKGQILSNMQGENGFGYDPIFVPDGATKSFANMTMDEKNTFSHRKKAVMQLFDFLEKL